MIDNQTLRDSFRQLYGREPRLFRAPGRVNLIGEHTDYNDGFVLPVAIDRATVVAGAARADQLVRVHSINFKESAEFDLHAAGRCLRNLWLDYVEGIARALQARGLKLRGADLVLFSDVPLGAGLSSSAALEISVGFALLALASLEIDRKGLARAAQAAEHTYVGAQVGIMDQLVSVMGRRCHALLIDCRSLATTQIPLASANTVFVVCDSHVKHELASSAYNQRRAECERGVEILRQRLPGIEALRDVSVAEFDRYAAALPETIRRRCRHVITENARTLAAAQALRAGDMAQMGRLMFRSHESLRADYEVSCAELDLLVEIAARGAGVLGARMTGGGFGGSTVNLLARESLDQFQEIVSRKYTEATNIRPNIYTVEASDGAGEIGAQDFRPKAGE